MTTPRNGKNLGSWLDRFGFAPEIALIRNASAAFCGVRQLAQVRRRLASRMRMVLRRTGNGITPGTLVSYATAGSLDSVRLRLSALGMTGLLCPPERRPALWQISRQIAERPRQMFPLEEALDRASGWPRSSLQQLDTYREV